jgi:hypothetical protein
MSMPQDELSSHIKNSNISYGPAFKTLLSDNEKLLCSGTAKTNTFQAIMARQFPVALSISFVACCAISQLSTPIDYENFVWTGFDLVRYAECFWVAVLLALAYCALNGGLSTRMVDYALTSQRMLAVDAQTGTLLFSCSIDRIERVREAPAQNGKGHISFLLAYDTATFLPRNNWHHLVEVDNPQRLMAAFQDISRAKLTGVE